MRERKWPDPTVSEPPLDEMLDDGVCETTDGCFVEQDGICEHGYPSWLLYKGMI